jgi:hypothetical protein
MDSVFEQVLLDQDTQAHCDNDPDAALMEQGFYRDHNQACIKRNDAVNLILKCQPLQ